MIEIPKFEDKHLICIDCGRPFIWTMSEQAYYYSKKLCPPKRCFDCRQARKASIIPDPGGNR